MINSRLNIIINGIIREKKVFIMKKDIFHYLLNNRIKNQNIAFVLIKKY